jgi:hypothetical protein
MKTNKKFILPLILLAGGGLALYFIMKGKKKPDIAPAPPAPANLPPPSFQVNPEKIVDVAKKVIAGIKKFKNKRDAAKAE